MTDLEHRLERLAQRGTHRPMDDVIDALQAALDTTTNTISNTEPDMLEITMNPASSQLSEPEISPSPPPWRRSPSPRD